MFGETVAEEDDLIDASGYDKEICILLPPSFIEHYGDHVIQCGADHIKGVQFDDDTLYVSYGKVAELFQPAIDGIIQCTLSALKDLEGEVDTIYLVGGFGGCKYVHAEIKSGKRQSSLMRVIMSLFLHPIVLLLLQGLFFGVKIQV